MTETYTWYTLDEFELDDILGFQTMEKMRSNLNYLKEKNQLGRSLFFSDGSIIIENSTTYTSGLYSRVYIPANPTSVLFGFNLGGAGAGTATAKITITDSGATPFASSEFTSTSADELKNGTLDLSSADSGWGILNLQIKNSGGPVFSTTLKGFSSYWNT